MPTRSSKAIDTLTAENRKLKRRISALQYLCAEMYQVAGTAGAPVRVLDKLWAASGGKPIPRVHLLPIAEDEFEMVRRG